MSIVRSLEKQLNSGHFDPITTKVKDVLTIEDILNNPISCGYLLSYCQIASYQQCVLFYMEVEKYRDTCKTTNFHDEENLRRCGAMVASIWYKFLANKSKYQISLASHDKKQTLERMIKMKKFRDKVFDIAMKSCLVILRRDIRGPFLKSTQFVELLRRESMTDEIIKQKYIIPEPENSPFIEDPEFYSKLNSLSLSINSNHHPLTSNNTMSVMNGTTNNNKNVIAQNSNQITISDVLQDKYFYNKMKEFLEKRYCVENLFCLREIMLFEKNCNQILDVSESNPSISTGTNVIKNKIDLNQTLYDIKNNSRFNGMHENIKNNVHKDNENKNIIFVKHKKDNNEEMITNNQQKNISIIKLLSNTNDTLASNSTIHQTSLVVPLSLPLPVPAPVPLPLSLALQVKNNDEMIQPFVNPSNISKKVNTSNTLISDPLNDIRTRAWHIYLNFLARGARYEISTTNIQRKHIMMYLGSPSLNMFHSIKLIIHKLLETDLQLFLNGHEMEEFILFIRNEKKNYEKMKKKKNNTSMFTCFPLFKLNSRKIGISTELQKKE